MNAEELFGALAALPGARVVRANGKGLGESRMVGEVEVVRAHTADEARLRRLWRERRGGGPLPLLLVTDDPEGEGNLHTLGPVSGEDQVRLVAADDLLRVLERLPGLSSLIAVRTLAEELVRLDRGGTPGLVVKGLGTEHIFSRRIRSAERWEPLVEASRGVGDGVEPTWRELLEGLGYEIERKSRGYVARHDGRPIVVVWPLKDASELSKLDRQGRPPEGVLINDCLVHGAGYGILAAGSRLRLFEARPATGSSTGRYLELDAGALPPEDRPLLGLLAPAYLADGRFEELMRDARAFGSDLRERLDRALRQKVLPELGVELGRWAREQGIDVEDDRERADLEAACLTFVFRALFLLYAESAGHLPISSKRYLSHSLRQIVDDAHDQLGELGARSTTLWGRIGNLVGAMRTGDPALGVPAYDGALFATDGFAGAEVLERAVVPDAPLGRALVALGIDTETERGVDFSGLEIGHLGHIYEGLLSLRLSVADRPYSYDPRADRYRPAEPDEAEIPPGELLWLTDEGGRKGGGVYYTPEALVGHLVRRSVKPAFEEHVERVRAQAERDPDAAARELLSFRVLDPACGSAHFLVTVVDELADRIARFLGERPLPGIRKRLDDLRAGVDRTYGVGVEDVALLRRLVVKHCVYGVDASEMGAEIAKVSLWLASFVPGLALSYLDHNVQVGNSLIGVADPEHVREPGEEDGQMGMIADRVRNDVARGAEAARALVELPDRTPEEVAQSKAADAEAHGLVAGTHRMLDLWAAEPLGLEGARDEVWEHRDELFEGEETEHAEEAAELARQDGVLHWPLRFPEVFAGGGEAGFDAVVGNPPWEEVTVEELGFYARYLPGLRALAEGERRLELERLKERRPELTARLQAERERAERLRHYFGADTGYEGGAGDPDLYKLFCQRYRVLLRPGGALGVVLPRSAFSAKGSEGFREWLLGSTTVERLDFLINRGLWIFDTHPQYTVALLSARAESPSRRHRVEAAGVAASESGFERQSARDGIKLEPAALGPAREVPLLPGQRHADLLAKVRRGEPFPHGCGRWRCFPVRELDETNDRHLWQSGEGERQLWKGESFNQYDPHGTEARRCPESDEALRKARKPRPGAGSLLAAEVPAAERAAAVAREVDRARVAFRDVSRATDSRTVLAALVPPGVFLTNKAPYLAFLDDRDAERAACLGLMNSLAFDWQARRFVETNVNFFILEGLRLPSLSEDQYERIARAAARLSCVDERFEAFAGSVSVDCGPLDDEERERLLVEVDALVALAYGLDDADLELVLDDFTLDAVPEPYRERLRDRFRELRAEAGA